MMAAVIQAAKRAIGKVDHEGAVQHARGLVADAKEAFARVETRQTEATTRAREAFEADNTEDHADALAQAERRAEIMLRAGREKVAVAEALLAGREKDALAAKIAQLEAVARGITERATAEIVPELERHLLGLIEQLNRFGALQREGLDAMREANKLAGVPWEKWPARDAVIPSGGWLRTIIANRGHLARLQEIEHWLR